MLSIPVDGRRYAIADLGSSCESFELNFRGYGEYTISLKDNGQMGYVHLIDRATGKTVDSRLIRTNHARVMYDCPPDMVIREV